MTITPQGSMEQAILDTLEKQSEQIKERAIRIAVATFEKELRVAVGNIAISIADYYSISRNDNELVIRVQIEKELR